MRAPDPPLTDERVSLRAWTPGDVADIVRCCNDPLIARYVAVLPVPYTDEDARAYIAQNDPRKLDLAITDADGGRMLGAVGVGRRHEDPAVAEIGYWLGADARGRGAATCALHLLSAWVLRELPVARLQLTTDAENEASQRVAIRAGFTREGLLRAWYDRRGERRDAVMFSLLPGDPQA